MKVKRQNISEEYNTTVDWINDFSNNLNKNADYLTNLKSIMKSRNDFSSTDEKIADLKSRVGFDLIKNVQLSEGKNIKSASCACGGSCNSCQMKSHYGEDAFEKVRNIVKYIGDLVSDRPDASLPMILSECRENPELGFSNLEGMIDPVQLRDLITKLTSKHEKVQDKVEYIPQAEISVVNDDDVADYINHASPGS
jgi:hypothetical protein|tara:strand:- start:44 stop:631 length:588 start_codon:yes stop_codon:yes gene_type:complete